MNGLLMILGMTFLLLGFVRLVSVLLDHLTAAVAMQRRARRLRAICAPADYQPEPPCCRRASDRGPLVLARHLRERHGVDR